MEYIVLMVLVIGIGVHGTGLSSRIPHMCSRVYQHVILAWRAAMGVSCFYLIAFSTVKTKGGRWEGYTNTR